MRYFPDEKPKPTLKEQATKWLGRVLLFALLGPFAIVYLVALLGGPMPGGWFGTWLMGALTIGGIITTLQTLESVKAHGVSELGCTIPIAGVTCWWGWIFLRDLGVFQ